MSAERLYRLLLAALLPRGFRAEAEDELLEVFRSLDRRRRARHRPGRLRFWAVLVLDLLRTAAAERLPHHASPSPRRRRGIRSLPMMCTRLFLALAGDVRFALRGLVRRPGWTLLASGTLALGLAASTVAGVLVRDVILRPLPIPGAERLVRVLEISEDGRGWWPSYPNARDWQQHARVFDALAICGTPTEQPVLLADAAHRVPVARAGVGLFPLLALTPIAGRLFAADDHRPGGAPVAIVSERFWRGPLQQRTIGDAALTLGIGTDTYTVIGVLPDAVRILGEAGRWTTAADVWTPLERHPALGTRGSHGGYHVIARLRPDVTLGQARSEMNELATALKAQHREPTQADRIRLTPLHDVVVGTAREPLRLLLYTGLGVLLVACLNLSAAILAQGLSRTRELLIRGALGATPWRLTAHLLVGAVTLALPGTIFGFALAGGGLRAVKSYAAGTWPRLDEARLDLDALAIALGVAAVTALLAGVLPALRLTRPANRDQLRTRGASADRGEPRLWQAFVAGQVALTLLLLVASGLLVRSFVRATRVDLGYRAAEVLVLDVSLPIGRYAEAGRRAAFYEDALARLRALPGVEAAGLTSALPHATTAYTSSTRREEVREPRTVMAGYRLIDAGYLEVVGIPIRQGDASVLEEGGVLIDRRLVDLLWTGPVQPGDRITSSFDRTPLIVGGMVGTIREWDQGDETVGAVYVHFTRQPIASMHLLLRHRPGLAASVAASAREALRELDPLVPIETEALERQVADALAGPRLLLVIALGFAGTALALAAAGVYAMTAFAAGRRTQEAAIRLALGAAPGDVQRRMLWRGLVPAAAGCLLGAGLSLPLGRSIESHLFQVQPFDPLVLAAAVVALLGASVAASAGPARRSARVDPLTALRQD